MTRYLGASKSLEGSVAFVVVAFFCVHVPLLVWSDVGRSESLLIAATLALLVMLLEGSAWRGLDNLFIPIGGYFLLRAYMPLEAAALAPRLVVTLALVVLVVFFRRRTTLGDDSLVASAFLCYVAWAVMGWPWLIGPLAIALGYRWLSPPTPDNSRRMHDMPAVLSVWAPAIGWLALARALGEPAMLSPYTIVFGAHLAMFGTSRLAFQFPDRPVALLFWRAVVTSWAIVLVPYVALTGASILNLATALGAIGAMALGTAAFVWTQPEIRTVAQTRRRWLNQAAAATIASAAGWAFGWFVASAFA
jgi:phytol kinase